MTNTKTTHTQAPWTLQPNSWIMANGDVIATVSSAGNNTGHDYNASGETLANARLMASAPLLLEALEKGLSGGWLRQELYDNALAAIKQAKGE